MLADEFDTTAAAATLYFDRLAPLYDQATQPPGAWTPPDQLCRALADIKVTDAKSLVIGVGTGHDVAVLRAAGVKRIEGIDVSGAMLAQAATKFPDVLFHHADFLTFEALTMAPYDLIVCSGVVEFMPDLALFLRKCRALMTRSAALLLSFEPIIAGYSGQDEAYSLLPAQLSPAGDVPGIGIHRHYIGAFLRAAAEAKLILKALSAYTAYRRQQDDVIYCAAHLENTYASGR